MMSTLICKAMIFLMLGLKAFSLPLPECSTQHQEIHLHPKMFQDNYYSNNVTLKDVGAFKYYCTQRYLSSIVNQYVDEFDDEVSDNIH